MSVAGYEKVKTKVIEGKKKCIYKKPNGTKLYVKGFRKMRTVENYIKLCKKAAAKSAAKSAAKPAAKSAAKPMKAKKARSKSAKKYGGFLEEFFANMENSDKITEKKKGAVDVPHPATPAKSDTSVVPTAAHSQDMPPSGNHNEADSSLAAKKGGSSYQKQGGKKQGGNAMTFDFSKMLSMGGYRGGQSLEEFQDKSLEEFQDLSQDGGRRKKRNKASKSKKHYRKGGDAIADSANALGSFTDSLMKTGGKKGGSSAQLEY